MIVNVTSLDRDEGTIATFAGRDADSGEPVLIAVEHRYAQYIVDALDDGPVPVYCELWQVWGTGPYTTD